MRRPAQKHIDVPPEVVGPFGGQTKVVFSTNPVKPGPAPAPAPQPVRSRPSTGPGVPPPMRAQPPAPAPVQTIPRVQPDIAPAAPAPPRPAADRTHAAHFRPHPPFGASASSPARSTRHCAFYAYVCQKLRQNRPSMKPTGSRPTPLRSRRSSRPSPPNPRPRSPVIRKSSRCRRIITTKRRRPPHRLLPSRPWPNPSPNPSVFPPRPHPRRSSPSPPAKPGSSPWPSRNCPGPGPKPCARKLTARSSRVPGSGTSLTAVEGVIKSGKIAFPWKALRSLDQALHRRGALAV